MKQIMAVYDSDSEYAKRLCDVLMKKECLPFTVMVFTSVQCLCEFMQREEVEVLLVDVLVGQETIESMAANHKVLLTDGSGIQMEQEYCCIYKYQSVDRILQELLHSYQPDQDEQPRFITPMAQIIGVYSPVNRCSKTSFCLTIGQLLARDQKVLYLNFEDCSGLSKFFLEEVEGDLSDVLYHYKHGGGHFQQIKTMVHSMLDLDYIKPVRYPEDLSQLSTQDLSDFVVKMAKESPYDVLVLDLGSMGRQIADVLEVCNVIYMPIKEDSISRAKVEEFYGYLKQSGRETVAEKIHRLNLPAQGGLDAFEDSFHGLLWGELGDYVRQLLKV